MQKLRVAILLFEGVEVLDFAGPFEVFSRARTIPGIESRRDEECAPFEVFTVTASASSTGTVRATGGLRVVADHDLSTSPPIDVLVVPGGFGTRPLLEDTGLLDWIRATAKRARLTTSVCTGALLLARAGLLRGKRATTHWGALDALAALDPSIDIRREERVVHDGVATSAGVAAGIDMALNVVERLVSKAVADETARYIEYPRA